MTTFYIVRHGQSHANVAKEKGEKASLLGEKGTGLTEKGKQQASEVADLFKSVKIGAIITSDVKRAFETATIIHNRLQTKLLRIDLGIHERKRGKRFGYMNGVEIKESLGQEYKEFEAFDDDKKFTHKFSDDYETDLEAAVRMEQTLKRLAIEFPEQTLLLVTHGAISRAFLVHIGHAKYKEVPSGSFVNCGYVKVILDNDEFIVSETKGLTIHHAN